MDNHKYREELKARLLSFNKEFVETCNSCSRRTEDVQVIYATKYLNSNQFGDFLNICKEIDLAPVLVGENRVQVAEVKFNHICNNFPELQKLFKPIMIGNLQKNKINKTINLFEEIHAIDSLDLAQALNERLKREGKTMSIFLEVNISGEETKHGIGENELKGVIRSIRDLNNLKLKGLMTMAPIAGHPEEVRPIFRKLRKLADQNGLLTSMGMSSDWRIAVEEGSDFIRVGSRIFM